MPRPDRPVYNCIPDRADARDLLATGPRRAQLAQLPKSVDLWDTHHVPEIWNQGSLGSCTGHGIGRAFEIERRRAGFAPRMPSRLFIYYNERADEGTIAQDSGAQIRDGIKVCAKFGVAQEPLWPYAIDQFAVKPPVAAYDDGAAHQITRYTRIDASPEGVAASLATGRPVVFGFQVFSSFESPAVAETGQVPMPAHGEAILGGHCVCATGYRLSADGHVRGGLAGLIDRLLGRPPELDGWLLCDNSWGPDWGIGGRFWLPFAFFRKGLAFDAWTVDAVEA